MGLRGGRPRRRRWEEIGASGWMKPKGGDSDTRAQKSPSPLRRPEGLTLTDFPSEATMLSSKILRGRLMSNPGCSVKVPSEQTPTRHVISDSARSETGNRQPYDCTTVTHR
jgi:hypothetical protein